MVGERDRNHQMRNNHVKPIQHFSQLLIQGDKHAQFPVMLEYVGVGGCSCWQTTTKTCRNMLSNHAVPAGGPTMPWNRRRWHHSNLQELVTRWLDHRCAKNLGFGWVIGGAVRESSNYHRICIYIYIYIHTYIYNIYIYTLKIKQTPLSDKLKPQIWVLEWCSFKKPKVFTSLNGEQLRTPKSTEG